MNRPRINHEEASRILSQAAIGELHYARGNGICLAAAVTTVPWQICYVLDYMNDDERSRFWNLSSWSAYPPARYNQVYSGNPDRVALALSDPDTGILPATARSDD